MASSITLQVIDPGPHARPALEAAQEIFDRAEAACTRFDPDSPLMRPTPRDKRGQRYRRSVTQRSPRPPALTAKPGPCSTRG
jgi:hypothetical protein